LLWVLFLWANTLSPFCINRQKTETLEPLELLSPPMVNNIRVKIIQKLESGVERRRRMNNRWSGVEAFVFAEDTNSLSIYDLARNALENTLVIATKEI
jgi:hypothetical protein